MKTNAIAVYKTEISRTDIEKAEHYLVDRGIKFDEAQIILQTLGYILLDVGFESILSDPNNTVCEKVTAENATSCATPTALFAKR